MAGIKKDATIDDIVEAITQAYSESKKQSKNKDEIVNDIMDILYDYIKLQSDNDLEKESSILKMLCENYIRLPFYSTLPGKLILVSNSSLVQKSDLSHLISLIRGTSPYDAMTQDDRAREMLILIKANSPKAQSSSPAITEDSESTHSRDSRADSDATIFSDDEDDEVYTAVNTNEITEEQLRKYNEMAMNDYKDVITNLMKYCDFLIIKSSSEKVNNIEQRNVDINQIKLKCIHALGMLDPRKTFESKNLPISIPELIKYTNFTIRFESDLDTRIMQQEILPKKITPDAPEVKKQVTLASKIVDALSKLLDTLLLIKNAFRMYFAPSANVPKVEDMDKKNLMLFYNSVQPGIEDDLNLIRENVSKLRDLPKPND